MFAELKINTDMALSNECSNCRAEVDMQLRPEDQVHEAITECLECGEKFCREHGLLHFTMIDGKLDCANMHMQQACINFLRKENARFVDELDKGRAISRAIVKERDSLRNQLAHIYAANSELANALQGFLGDRQIEKEIADARAVLVKNSALANEVAHIIEHPERLPVKEGGATWPKTPFTRFDSQGNYQP